MAIFNSLSWTGNDRQTQPGTVVQEKPRAPTAPAKLRPRVDSDVMAESAIAEYRQVAKEVGISDQDMMVEEFRLFLAKNDIPTFNLQEVVAYMDEVAAKDNPTKLGWQWCPVREKDAVAAGLTFGRRSTDYRNGPVAAASDYYASHDFLRWLRGESGTIVMGDDVADVVRHPPHWRDMPSPAYTRTLPLHALKKIAFVEKNFKGGQVLFLVTDYVTAPHVVVNPDPFLMAVVPNSAVAHGKGRFVIDVWDEPGFGIERMVR